METPQTIPFTEWLKMAGIMIKTNELDECGNPVYKNIDPNQIYRYGN